MDIGCCGVEILFRYRQSNTQLAVLCAYVADISDVVVVVALVAALCYGGGNFSMWYNSRLHIHIPTSHVHACHKWFTLCWKLSIAHSPTLKFILNTNVVYGSLLACAARIWYRFSLSASLCSLALPDPLSVYSSLCVWIYLYLCVLLLLLICVLRLNK